MKYFAKLLPVPGGFSRVVKNGQGIPVDYEREVKLYLCTHDIKEGEEFVSGLSKEVWIKGKGMTMHPKDCRVVCEISPQASWVKSGDEFDESKVMFGTFYFNEEEGWSNKYALIKGQCGHFH